AGPPGQHFFIPRRPIGTASGVPTHAGWMCRLGNSPLSSPDHICCTSTTSIGRQPLVSAGLGPPMQSRLSAFESHQLSLNAGVTPYAMAGHILNTTVLALALAGSIPSTHLILWCAYSYAIALLLLYRHRRRRGRVARNFQHAANKATAYAF